MSVFHLSEKSNLKWINVALKHYMPFKKAVQKAINLKGINITWQLVSILLLTMEICRMVNPTMSHFVRRLKASKFKHA